MRPPLSRYRSVIADSARWDSFRFRDGDIVISAPMKCGTTWIQMVCGLLTFQQPRFPATLDLISPWLDMLTRSLPEVLKDLDAQQHRRFIKSHTPLDGLPFEDRATYICVCRDPRDVALSFINHMMNTNVEAFLLARYMAVGVQDLSSFHENPIWAGSEHDRFWQWMDAPTSPGLKSMIHHLSTFWEMREHPNVILIHYNDLKTDLEGQMRELARRLGVSVSEPLWPELVRAATFEEMRGKADEIVPNSTEALWYNNHRFFHRGTTGQWQSLLQIKDLIRYRARILELADPELAAWMHQGPIAG
jgi:aryl sulfotransferase